MNVMLHYSLKLASWVLTIKNNFCYLDYAQFFREDNLIFISFHQMMNL